MTEKIKISEGSDPAFYTDWIETTKGKPTILITKDFPSVKEKMLNTFPPNYIFHVTCTGFAQTIFEPYVPSVDYVLKSISNLNDYQKSHIVLRVDPICPPLFTYYGEIDGVKYYEQFCKILDFARNNKLRVRISFLDMYEHIWERLKGFPSLTRFLKKSYGNDIHLPLDLRKRYVSFIEHMIEGEVEVCAEPGINCTGCISEKDLDILGIYLKKKPGKNMQRPACNCLALKEELIPIRKRCPHMCMYCYWR